MGVLALFVIGLQTLRSSASMDWLSFTIRPLRHGIVATFTKGLATQNSFEAQPAAFGGTIPVNRFSRVLRAAWSEAAVLTKKRAQGELIASDNGQ